MEGENNNVTHEIEMYKECLKNHAASLGSYATDGCGEFTLDDTNSLTGGRLNCAACGCHRNFHHKVTHGGSRRQLTMAQSPETSSEGAGSRKRFRTKFTEEQKEKMLGFAEKLGWRMQRKDGDQLDEIERFCRGVGVRRKVFKVWMHNNKMNFRLHCGESDRNAASLTDD